MTVFQCVGACVLPIGSEGWNNRVPTDIYVHHLCRGVKAFGQPGCLLCHLLYAVAGMRGLDRTGNEGSLLSAAKAESLPAGGCCVISWSCPYFQTGGRQRGPGGKRWRGGWRLCFCLETSTSPTILPPVSLQPSMSPSPSPRSTGSREARFCRESGSTHPLLLSLRPAV